MKKLASVVLLVLFIGLSACSRPTKPLAWKSSEFIFNSRMTFAIQPVANATGHFINEDILTLLTAKLRHAFRDNDLKSIESEQTTPEILIVKSEVLKYTFQYYTGPPPASGQTQGLCIIRTQLLEAAAGQVVAEIMSINKRDVGQGILEPKDPESILQEAATTIAREIVKLM